MAAANGFAGFALRIVPEHGWAYALAELFGISAILWVALAACLALLRQEGPAQPIRGGDRWMAGAVAFACLLPFPPAGTIALTALALWMIATGGPGSRGRRAGAIALAMTASLLWGRVFLAAFSRPLLGIDTWLVGHLAGVPSVGNTLAFADGSGGIAIAPGCSSWQGISLALVFWVTLNQWFGIGPGWRPYGWFGLAAAAAIVVNVARIAAMVRYPRHLAEIHDGYGWHLAMWTSLLLVCAICLYGARREVFTR